MVRVTLVRNATLLIEIGGRTLLVDPALDPPGTHPPQPASNDLRNPLVGLPDSADAIVSQAEAVCVTHTHIDHLDEAATAALLERGLPVLCQPQDEAKLRELGFAEVRPVADALTWEGIEVVRTDGRHGTGELGELLAPVSGFVLSCDGDRVYVAGDTIWCDEVRSAIAAHDPTVVIVNAGGARYPQSDPIIMDADDVIEVARQAHGDVVAVHMETWNHCLLSRAELAAEVERAGVAVLIPADGETIALPGRPEG